MEEDVQKWLALYHITVRPDWLNAAIQFSLQHAPPELPVDKTEWLRGAVLEQVLHSRLADFYLPPMRIPAVAVKAFLHRKILFEILSVVDVSRSAYQQLHELTREADDLAWFNEEEDENKGKQPEELLPHSRRALRISLANGVTQLLAFEYGRFTQVDTGTCAGTKLMITGKVMMRRGVLFLNDNNCQVLGGSMSPEESMSLADMLEQRIGGKSAKPSRPTPKVIDSANTSSISPFLVRRPRGASTDESMSTTMRREGGEGGGWNRAEEEGRGGEWNGPMDPMETEGGGWDRDEVSHTMQNLSLEEEEEEKVIKTSQSIPAPALNRTQSDMFDRTAVTGAGKSNPNESRSTVQGVVPVQRVPPLQKTTPTQVPPSRAPSIPHSRLPIIRNMFGKAITPQSATRNSAISALVAEPVIVKPETTSLDGSFASPLPPPAPPSRAMPTHLPPPLASPAVYKPRPSQSSDRESGGSRKESSSIIPANLNLGRSRDLPISSHSRITDRRGGSGKESETRGTACSSSSRPQHRDISSYFQSTSRDQGSSSSSSDDDDLVCVEMRQGNAPSGLAQFRNRVRTTQSTQSGSPHSRGSDHIIKKEVIEHVETVGVVEARLRESVRRERAGGGSGRGEEWSIGMVDKGHSHKHGSESLRPHVAPFTHYIAKELSACAERGGAGVGGAKPAAPRPHESPKAPPVVRRSSSSKVVQEYIHAAFNEAASEAPRRRSNELGEAPGTDMVPYKKAREADAAISRTDAPNAQQYCSLDRYIRLKPQLMKDVMRNRRHWIVPRKVVIVPLFCIVPPGMKVEAERWKMNLDVVDASMRAHIPVCPDLMDKILGFTVAHVQELTRVNTVSSRTELKRLHVLATQAMKAFNRLDLILEIEVSHAQMPIVKGVQSLAEATAAV